MKIFVADHIMSLKPYVPGKPLEEVQRELGLSSIIKLASNENPLGVSPLAVRAIKKNLKKLNRYPDGNCYYLKDKLAKKLKVKPANLICGNGSNEIIELVIKTFMDEEKEVIMNVPDFLIFKLATLQENGTPKEIPLRDFQCDLAAIKKAITKNTRIIFIANPNNPVGTYVGRGELDAFINDVPDNIIIVLDEAYYEFAREAVDYPDSLSYIKKKNIIISRTFSKAYGLSGLRLGYAIANEEMIQYLNSSRQPFNVNLLAQAGGLGALDDDKFLAKTLQATKEGKIYLYKELNALGLKYIASATNFILIDVGRDAEDIFKKMLKQGVIVRHMSAYGLDSWIRVTIGRMPDNRRFISALKQVLQGEKS